MLSIKRRVYAILLFLAVSTLLWTLVLFNLLPPPFLSFRTPPPIDTTASTSPNTTLTQQTLPTTTTGAATSSNTPEPKTIDKGAGAQDTPQQAREETKKEEEIDYGVDLSIIVPVRTPSVNQGFNYSVAIDAIATQTLPLSPLFLNIDALFPYGQPTADALKKHAKYHAKQQQGKKKTKFQIEVIFVVHVMLPEGRELAARMEQESKNLPGVRIIRVTRRDGAIATTPPLPASPALTTMLEVPQAEAVNPKTTQSDIFKTGCNVGGQHARGHFLIFLSENTVPEAGWLKEFARKLPLPGHLISHIGSENETIEDTADPDDVGVYACKVLYKDDKLLHSTGYDVSYAYRERSNQEKSSEVVHMIWPHSRLAGYHRNDSRAQQQKDIVGASSLCFAVSKRNFKDAKGLMNKITINSMPARYRAKAIKKQKVETVQSISENNRKKGYLSPQLQVWDLSLRLLDLFAATTVYMPTKYAVLVDKKSATEEAKNEPIEGEQAKKQKSESTSEWERFSQLWKQKDPSDLMEEKGIYRIAEEDYAFYEHRKSGLRSYAAAKSKGTLFCANTEIIWDFYGGCTGFGLEAFSFIAGLDDTGNNVSIIAGKDSFCKGLPTSAQDSLHRIRARLPARTIISEQNLAAARLLQQATLPSPTIEMSTSTSIQSAILPSTTPRAITKKSSTDVSIWVSQKPPRSYPSFPYRGSITLEERPDYVVGRSVAETSRIQQDWVKACNNDKLVDEIWVSATFLIDVFVQSGVRKSKLHVIPIPLDTYLYDPSAVEPLPLPAVAPVKASDNKEKKDAKTEREEFRFLSIFKWERRKGWDILLEAYWREFKPEDNTVLYIQTYLYGVSSSLARDSESVMEVIEGYAKVLGLEKEYKSGSLPRVKVMCDELVERDMPRLFKAADAFVLPSRGEGFGMPAAEAMAMGLPTIATAWSGMTQFMTSTNSYPLSIDGLAWVHNESLPMDKMQTPYWFSPSSGDNAYEGKWAQPSKVHLQELMREVYTNREEAHEKGQTARADIVRDLSQSKVASQVVERMRAIREIVLQRRATRP